MKINHSVEKDDGTYVMQGTLTGKELEFIVEVGCNYLLAQGAFPFLSADEDESDPVIPHPTPDMAQ